MQSLYGVGPGVDEELVAPFECGSPEIVDREIHQLQVGSGRAVVDQNPLRQGAKVGIGFCCETWKVRDSSSHKE